MHEEEADIDSEETALSPRAGSDSPEEIARFVPASLLKLYEVHSYRHAATILANNHAEEFAELQKALHTTRGRRPTPLKVLAAQRRRNKSCECR